MNQHIQYTSIFLRSLARGVIRGVASASNRHWNLRVEIERGKHKLVSEDEWNKAKPKRHQKMTVDTVWARALEAAKKTEDEVGLDNLGPWSDFEWGMLNGKLSALRWVMGSEWDFLDT